MRLAHLSRCDAGRKIAPFENHNGCGTHGFNNAFRGEGFPVYKLPIRAA